MVWACKKCGKVWHYPVDVCIFCNSKIEEMKPEKYTVRGSTKVFIPSEEHKDVPYNVLLLEDDGGNMHIRKSFVEHKIGSKITGGKEKEKRGLVGVVGSGLMGAGIAQVAASAGFTVILKSRSRDAAQRARKKIEKNLRKSSQPDDLQKIMGRIRPTVDLHDLKDADIVIESVVEDAATKKKLFRELAGVCSKKTVFATNTSSLSVDELASGISYPSRVVGLHFFNPAQKMRLVEVVRGAKTSGAVVDFALGFVKALSKVPVVTKDTPCFVVNRMLMPYLNEAVYALAEGVASAEDIDTAAKLGLNHPIGPLALIDLIGLDVFLAIMNNLYKRTKNPRYMSCKLVEKMVREGRLGRKVGSGFFKYGGVQ